MQGIIGKAFALLWALFLLVGPTFQAMRDALRRVGVITTDCGTERLLIGVRDILPMLYRAIGGVVPRGMRRPQERLFPFAVRGIGELNSSEHEPVCPGRLAAPSAPSASSACAAMGWIQALILPIL